MRVEQEQQIVEEHLKKQGFRWTNQRALIVKQALETHDHFTAEELLDACRKVDARVSRATVYRTLAVLEKARFVEGLETGDGGRKFEHVIGHDHHDHMVCTACGAIFEFHDEELERRQELAARRLGFRIEHHSLRIYGQCKACRAASADQASGRGKNVGQKGVGPKAGKRKPTPRRRRNGS